MTEHRHGPSAGSPDGPNPKGGANAPAGGDAATAAGRGGIAVLGAKLFFLVTGFIQQPLLRIAVGLTDFGALAQALVVANTVNNVIVSSATQGVSRIVASAKGHEDEALRATLRVHGPIAVLVALAMVAATPLYAGFERADDVIAPLLVLALVAFCYGLYAPLIGYLNGRHRFGRQAALDVVFATLRTIGLVGVGRAFVVRGASGVLGTTVGWVAAAACIVPLAMRSTGLGKRAPREAIPGVPAAGAYVKLLIPIAGAQLCTNALLQADIALLGRFLSESAGAASAYGIAPGRDAIKSWLAIYKECQTYAFLPYQLLFSVTLVLFPMLARARAENDAAAVRTYVAQGARLAAIFGGLLVAVIVAIPESLLGFAYGFADARRGASVLPVMAVAQGAFAMLSIATVVLTSIGRERAAAWITLGALGAVLIACAVLVRGAPFGLPQLVRSAHATAIALVAALLVAAALVRGHTGAFVPAATALRVAFAVVVCFAAGRAIPCVGRLVTPPLAALVGIAYVVVLVGTREIRREDAAWVRALVLRRRA